MLRTDLNSTSLSTVGYRDRPALLELEFRGGAIYQYWGVPEATYQGLLLSQSKGAYFNRYIRNRFAYAKICGEERATPERKLLPVCPNP